MERSTAFFAGAVCGAAAAAAIAAATAAGLLMHVRAKEGAKASDPREGRRNLAVENRKGLQPLLHSLNHVAVIVRDVGQSLFFYTDIIGFEQIRRPNFDRHGAWLTMGNVELHLIKGEPACHRGQHPSDLIVSHLAIEVKDCEQVLKRMRQLKTDVFHELTWRQNISVPTPAASRAAKFETDHKSSAGKVTQFFLEDPDGYWLELCNCDVLTDFCFGNDDVKGGHHPAFRYEEGCEGVGMHGLADVPVKMCQ
eukprot:TRINITY_DN80731_c0_g1_i1.p1 TRINITY_DN80731_c0_g1~~TRINITY_DN80731_c0_g1_i1.p1  ORF type:complete len:252 (-),score=34.64 TRINITY_DN80731_c0_g1_i1:594-1349(-)